MRDVNLETIIVMLSWCRTWPPNGSRRIRAKQKLHRKPREACKSSLSRRGNQKPFTLTISFEFGKACEDLSWKHCVRQHLTVQKQMGLLRERHAGCKKGLVRYCCNQVWMKNGGQILWNATAICGSFKIHCLMGRHPMKDIWENHWSVTAICETYGIFSVMGNHLANGDSANHSKDQQLC